MEGYGELRIWDTQTGETVDSEEFYGASQSYVTAPHARFVIRDGGVWTGRGYIHLPTNECTDERKANALLKFSPSGDYLITGVGCGEQIQLWDTTQPINPDMPTIVLDSENLIGQVGFSPDEKRIVTNEENYVSHIWDAQTGTLLFQLEGEAAGAQFSGDGELLSGIDSQQRPVLWDASTGKRIITLPKTAVLNADLSHAAYWIDNTIVRVIETQTGKSDDLNIIDDYMGSLSAFSADAGKVIFNTDKVRGYDLTTGDAFFQKPLTEGVPWAEFSADGSHFFTAARPIVDRSAPTVINIWNTDHTDHPIHRFELPYSPEYAFSNDNELLAELDWNCSFTGGNYRLWDTTTGELLLNFTSGSLCGPHSQTFSPDGKWAVIGWSDNVDVLNIAEAVQAASTNEDHYLNKAHTSFATSTNRYTDNIGVQVSPNGEYLVVTMKFSDWQDGALDYPIESYEVVIFNFRDLIGKSGYLNNDIEKHVAIPNAQHPQFSPDSLYLLTEFGLYDPATGEQLAALRSDTAAFSPDSKILATFRDDGLQLWDVSALAKDEATPLATFDTQGTQELAFNPTGNLLYVRRSNEVQVWGIPPVS